MKIVVDCYGNDRGPEVAVKASINVVKDYDDTQIVLCGKEEELHSILNKYEYDKSKIEVVNATEVITNDDTPTEAIRKKLDSSLVKSFDTLKQDKDVVGMVSCGSTGAVLTGAFLKVGRIKGISRPALCPILPTKTGGKVMLIDSGANVDCKPINICHFAVMATIYAKEFLGKENPTVALLNIGTEEKKGNEFTHECYKLLKQMPINFVGNMEARDFMSGKYDIVVTDGFYGNILLKSVEGMAIFMMTLLKKSIKESFMSKVGALFMKHTFKELKSVLDYHNHGGALFVGAKKLIVKGHGASDTVAFEKSILQVRALALKDLCKQIETEVVALGDKLDGAI